MAMLFASLPVSSYDFESNGIFYKILSMDNLTVEVTYGDYTYKGIVSIPSHVTFGNAIFKVKSIGSRCFEGCQELLELSLPDEINNISYRSFFGCSSLKKVNLSPSVLYIGREAFQECISLKSINLPTSLKEIQYRTFSGCTGLTEIIIPANIKVIDEKAFEGTINIKKVTLEDSSEPIEIYGCY